MMPRLKQGWVGMELVKPEGQVGGSAMLGKYLGIVVGGEVGRRVGRVLKGWGLRWMGWKGAFFISFLST